MGFIQLHSFLACTTTWNGISATLSVPSPHLQSCSEGVLCSHMKSVACLALAPCCGIEA